MIITNQTPIKDTQKMGIKEDKIIKENHQTAKGETKRRKEQTENLLYVGSILGFRDGEIYHPRSLTS